MTIMGIKSKKHCVRFAAPPYGKIRSSGWSQSAVR